MTEQAKESTDSMESLKVKEKAKLKEVSETESEADSGNGTAPEPPSSDESSHSLLGEEICGYKIESFIGSGGMGDVYRATRTKSGNVYAIKVLRKELLKDKSSMKRFEQEAKACSSLSSPHIVSVYQSGVSEEGLPYLVMDLVDGMSLSQLLKENGTLSPEEFLEIFSQVCEAIDYAHENKIFHRDIKPSNILVTKDESDKYTVKLVDFGISRFLQDSNLEEQQVTKTGELIGSPIYMSPEQCAEGKFDHQSEVYSLGVVMYETLTGTPPLVGHNAVSTILKHVNDIPEPVFKGDKDKQKRLIEQIVLRCLEKDPMQRYATIDALKKDIDTLAVEHNDKRLETDLRKASWRRYLSIKGKRIWVSLITIFAVGVLIFQVINIATKNYQFDNHILNATLRESYSPSEGNKDLFQAYKIAEDLNKSNRIKGLLLYKFATSKAPYGKNELIKANEILKKSDASAIERSEVIYSITKRLKEELFKFYEYELPPSLNRGPQPEYWTPIGLNGNKIIKQFNVNSKEEEKYLLSEIYKTPGYWDLHISEKYYWLKHKRALKKNDLESAYLNLSKIYRTDRFLDAEIRKSMDTFIAETINQKLAISLLETNLYRAFDSDGQNDPERDWNLLNQKIKELGLNPKSYNDRLKLAKMARERGNDLAENFELQMAYSIKRSPELEKLMMESANKTSSTYLIQDPRLNNVRESLINYGKEALQLEFEEGDPSHEKFLILNQFRLMNDYLFLGRNKEALELNQSIFSTVWKLHPELYQKDRSLEENQIACLKITNKAIPPYYGSYHSLMMGYIKLLYKNQNFEQARKVLNAYILHENKIASKKIPNLKYYDPTFHGKPLLKKMDLIESLKKDAP